MSSHHTTATLDAFTLNEGWLGFGYIGSRNNAQAEGWRTLTADDLALSMANAAHLSTAAFFEWANSKNGRWFADIMLGDPNPDVAMARRYGPR